MRLGAESPCKPGLFSRKDFAEGPHVGFVIKHPLNPSGIVSALTEYKRGCQSPKEPVTDSHADCSLSFQ